MPVVAQLWGKKPENFECIAREIADGTIAGFAGVDLNFGCPDKAVLKNECCSALAKPELRDKADAIIRATKIGLESALGSSTPNSAAQTALLPLSIKTRLGFSSIDYTWHEFLLTHKPAMLTVHVRTTRQMSKVPAQWEAILPIVKLRDEVSPDTKIVLNGDVADRSHGEELAKLYGVDGIMIGRGIFKNPYCFADNAATLWASKTREERIALLRAHFELFIQMYPNNERQFAPLKKFAKVYISDFASASELREQIMQCMNIKEALELLDQMS